MYTSRPQSSPPSPLLKTAMRIPIHPASQPLVGPTIVPPARLSSSCAIDNQLTWKTRHVNYSSYCSPARGEKKIMHPTRFFLSIAIPAFERPRLQSKVHIEPCGSSRINTRNTPRTSEHHGSYCGCIRGEYLILAVLPFERDRSGTKGVTCARGIVEGAAINRHGTERSLPLTLAMPHSTCQTGPVGCLLLLYRVLVSCIDAGYTQTGTARHFERESAPRCPMSKLSLCLSLSPSSRELIPTTNRCSSSRVYVRMTYPRSLPGSLCLGCPEEV
ncbi:hypothetical protein BZA05DRAFT_401111 [Tricharina praecox]|uniref:uncharacterized protein n=1 Tax=Tricharina praecox TaxID=43433 RepID=UPI00222034B0|nr:uncharacterized protein BZA05DRAFT_401111 [Tricharina praecox]KAI5849683.1 hypothetical protein BZA05DRAFT_401111 [Tricharina praecox]